MAPTVADPTPTPVADRATKEEVEQVWTSLDTTRDSTLSQQEITKENITDPETRDRIADAVNYCTKRHKVAGRKMTVQQVYFEFFDDADKQVLFRDKKLSAHLQEQSLKINDALGNVRGLLPLRFDTSLNVPYFHNHASRTPAFVAKLLGQFLFLGLMATQGQDGRCLMYEAYMTIDHIQGPHAFAEPFCCIEAANPDSEGTLPFSYPRPFVGVHGKAFVSSGSVPLPLSNDVVLAMIAKFDSSNDFKSMWMEEAAKAKHSSAREMAEDFMTRYFMVGFQDLVGEANKTKALPRITKENITHPETRDRISDAVNY